jgi:hypothetical protein
MKEKASTGNPGPLPLLDSIYNTIVPTTKVALASPENFDEAVTQLSVIHSVLLSKIPPEYHTNIFTDSAQGITSHHIDSIHSCTSASYADRLLHDNNPKDDGKIENLGPKRLRFTSLSYAAVTDNSASPDPPIRADQPSSLSTSTMTDDAISELYNRMKQFLPPTMTSQTAQEMEEGI